MKLFLASSLRTEDGAALNPANGFLNELKQSLPSRLRILYICSDPDLHDLTDFYAGEIFDCFRIAGFDLLSAVVLDGRNQAEAAAELSEADLVVLAGGHVPTQNAFFEKIGLASLLKGFGGVILGTSAGSMNCAHNVYAHPEREGEASSADYKRFLRGLGLTQISILPHYHEIKSETLDGMSLIEDNALPDSIGREFIAIPDGSYLMCEDGYESRIRGEAYQIKDGVIRRL